MFTVYCLNIKLELEKGPVAKTKLSGRPRKLKRRKKKLFIVCLSGRAGKFKKG